MSQLIKQGYSTANWIVTQGLVYVTEPPTPPPPPPPSYFAVAVSATTGGTTDPVPDDYEVLTSETLTVTATASEGYSFYRWLLDDAAAGTNPTIIVSGTEDQQRTLIAQFTLDDPEPPTPPQTYTITVGADSRGSTTPAAGDHTYTEGETATLTAVAASGYIFLHWLKNGSIVESANPYTFTVDNGASFNPVYAAEPTDDAGTPYPITFGNLWNIILARVEAQGVNCQVTWHKLHLSDYPDSRGHYAEEFDELTCKAIIEPPSSTQRQIAVGKYTGVTAPATTNAEWNDGDQLTDAYGNLWRVASTAPYRIGNQTIYHKAMLELLIAGEGDASPPPSITDLKRLQVRVLDQDLLFTGELSVRVIDLDGEMYEVFPYRYPFRLG